MVNLIFEVIGFVKSVFLASDELIAHSIFDDGFVSFYSMKSSVAKSGSVGLGEVIGLLVVT